MLVKYEERGRPPNPAIPSREFPNLHASQWSVLKSTSSLMQQSLATRTPAQPAGHDFLVFHLSETAWITGLRRTLGRVMLLAAGWALWVLWVVPLFSG